VSLQDKIVDIKLKYTRAMINAVLNNQLENASFEKDPVFGILIPGDCEGVPAEILNPRNTWPDKALYDKKAKELAKMFITNFNKYASGVSEAILAAAPLV